MRLHDLKPRPGARHRRKRLGQGESSGHGKTSGRGGKGQTARSGSSIRIGFEGGQMPLIRRIPKRGFNNKRHGTRYVPVNLESLNAFDDGARVDEAALRSVGLANGPALGGVKILGNGDVKKKLSVSAHAFSASARTKIEAKGGTCELIGAPKPAAAKHTATKPAATKPAATKPATTKPATTKPGAAEPAATKPESGNK